jgi:hypothetical protein
MYTSNVVLVLHEEIHHVLIRHLGREGVFIPSNHLLALPNVVKVLRLLVGALHVEQLVTSCSW